MSHTVTVKKNQKPNTCQALTKSGQRCTNKANYPSNNPITCKIQAHMEQAKTIGHKIKQVIRSAPKIKVGSLKSKQATVTKKPVGQGQLIINESQLKEFLKRKREILSVLETLYRQGSKKYNNTSQIVNFMKNKFTADLFQINRKKLIEGLSRLETTKKQLLSGYLAPSAIAVSDYISFITNETDHTKKVITILDNLYGKGSGGGGSAINLLIQVLKEDDLAYLKAMEILSEAPEVEATGVKSSVINKVAVKLETK